MALSIVKRYFSPSVSLTAYRDILVSFEVVEPLNTPPLGNRPAAFIIIAWRYGLLALVSISLFNGLEQLPITTNFTAWYAIGFVMKLAMLVVLAVYGFYTSLAGQKPFGRKFLEERRQGLGCTVFFTDNQF